MASPRISLSRIALLVGAGAVACAAGCRHVDNVQTDLMERELRQQEDYIYELEDYLMEYSEKLRQARMMCGAETVVSEPSTKSTGSSTRSSGARRPIIEPELLDDTPRRKPPVSRPVTPTPPRTMTPRADVAPSGIEPAAPEAAAESTNEPPTEPEAAPADETDTAEPLDLENLDAPQLEIGPSSQADPRPRQLETNDGDQLAAIPDPADYEQEGELASVDEPTTAEDPTLAAPANADRHVPQQLEICRLFANPPADGRSPASLLTVVEVHGAAGEPLDADGTVSLMVMQGEATDQLTRIHRWDFTPDETHSAWQSSPLGDGLHFELPLEGVNLPPGRLELWARLVTADGRKLLTRVPFERDQLAAFDQANMQPTPTAALQPIPAPENLADYAESASDESSAIAPAAHEAGEDTATASATGQWRRATHHIGPRAEGFGATTTPSNASGWTARSQGSATMLR